MHSGRDFFILVAAASRAARLHAQRGGPERRQPIYSRFAARIAVDKFVQAPEGRSEPVVYSTATVPIIPPTACSRLCR